MAQEKPLTINQMTAMLDNIPAAIHVSALDTWELLYANQAARDILLKNLNGIGGACYQCAGLSEPCPFCKADRLREDEFLVREFHHPVDGHVYQLSGKLIDWAGQKAHIEYIQDITVRKIDEERSEALKQELQQTFSSIPCGLCVYRYNGSEITPLFHNPAFYDVMGYSADHIFSVEQQTDYLGVHPEDLAVLRGKIDRAVRENSVMQHTYRIWNDREAEYRWIRLDGSVKAQTDGSKLLYGVYSDVSEQKRLETELTAANEKMQDIVNAIPGGVAVFKVTDAYEPVYFSDGVPRLCGFTPEETPSMSWGGALERICGEDVCAVMACARRVIETRCVDTLEFRLRHRSGGTVWVRAQIKYIGEADCSPLLHCVFHNITDYKEAQLEMDHIINSIPGGIASYRVEENRFIPTYYSDGVLALSGHTREEFSRLLGDSAVNVIYEADRARVSGAAFDAVQSGEILDISYRMRHKNGGLVWIHMNGRRMGPLSDSMWFYAVFTSASAETDLFHDIAQDSADGAYVIDRNTYELLYLSESKGLFAGSGSLPGRKCYEALHGLKAPCSFCTLNSHAPDGKEHEMTVNGSDRYYTTRFKKANWNGLPAYIKYVRDITEEVNARREKERLEQYYQTVMRNLPGGVAVVRMEKNGRMIPEYISDGFAVMTGMSIEEAWRLYREDALKGVHPDDRNRILKEMEAYVSGDKSQCELEYRLKTGRGDYLWIRNSLSLIQNEGGDDRTYSIYHDITKERREKEDIRRQYEETLLQHYHAPGPDVLVLGHCNITQNRILEIIDFTNSGLLDTFGSVREEFFTGLAGLVTDEKERRTFLDTFLNEPALAAFHGDDPEQILRCFVKLPRDEAGRYVQFKVNLVETPYTGDITGVLTVTDVTAQTISDMMLHQLSVESYDMVADVDLLNDLSVLLTRGRNALDVPAGTARHSELLDYMLRVQVLPKDRERTALMMNREYMLDRLRREGSYSFSYSIRCENGEHLTKNMTISAADLRLERVCLARTDITESVREQQGPLNVIAYTFEILAFLNIATGRLTMHTRQTVLESLPPFITEDYAGAVERLVEFYGPVDDREAVREPFLLEHILSRLAERPAGYDFVLPYQSAGGLRYKQINVLWGDHDHKTVCMVRADVTDMLSAERRAKSDLEKALASAEQANQAKSDFLSSMSHDIRTPMNAIMGMTTLALANLEDRDKTKDCLQKITFSSKHLLSLINDILDMSKIERSKVSLSRERVFLPGMLDELSAMMTPQAAAAGVTLKLRSGTISHHSFYGDSLRLNQILINILGNAVKFTPEGGRAELSVEEVSPVASPAHVRYRFRISDTGVGMSGDFVSHIFEPFTRSRVSTRVEGTGLGLSITKGLVDLMEGDISVESRLHEGTTFVIELEFETASEEEETQQKEQDCITVNGDRISGCCFLVAEDNAINAEILCELLQIYGARCIVKTDGAQAYQAFRSSAPGTYDAVLMDIRMPEMNGYEATRAIRDLDRPDASSIPIVAMTANAFAEDIDDALKCGMNAHVAKPVDVGVLLGTLSRVLA